MQCTTDMMQHFQKVTNTKKIGCDISNIESIKNLVAKTLEAYWTVNILINNAGILYQKPISETTDEEWNAVINTNLKGPFMLTREVLPIFEKRGKGKIVNIASIAGIIGYENLSAYCASKGGIIAMTRSLALICPKENKCQLHLSRCY